MRNYAVPFFASRFRIFLLICTVIAAVAVSSSWQSAGAQGGRAIRAVGGVVQPGGQAVVLIELDAQGNESSASFTINFDPTKLSNPQVSIGSQVPPATALGSNVNQALQGRVGVLLDSTNNYAAGTRHMMTITFTVAANAAAGLSTISFGSTPTPQSVSSSGGALLSTTYVSGAVNIGGVSPSPTPTVAPSPTPTVAPSPTPTVGPSPTPTVAPSPTPTVEPSPTPTVEPSPTPTVAPSPTPTVAPSPTPTVPPSPTPTVAPSPTPNTFPGQNVLVESPLGSINATFAFIFQNGFTRFTQIGGPSAGIPPAGYQIPVDGSHFNVTTTAPFAGPVTVCIVAVGIDDPEVFARLRVLHREGSQVVDRTILSPAGPAPNFATRQVCASVDVPDNFYLAVGPEFTVAGTVVTPGGLAVRNTTVIMTDSRGVRYTATTGSFGTYSFDNARVGETYTLSVQSRRYRFQPRPIIATSDMAGIDFTGLE